MKVLRSVKKDAPCGKLPRAQGLERVLFFGGDGEGGSHYADSWSRFFSSLLSFVCVRVHVCASLRSHPLSSLDQAIFPTWGSPE